MRCRVPEWRKNVGAISLFVADLPRSKAFYQEVFGLPVTFRRWGSPLSSSSRTPSSTCWRPPQHPELIGPAQVGHPDSGARFQLTIWVDDADSICDDLRSHGVSLINGPMDRPWGQRTACFADPDGHVWGEIAQRLGRDLRRKISGYGRYHNKARQFRNGRCPLASTRSPLHRPCNLKSYWLSPPASFDLLRDRFRK